MYQRINKKWVYTCTPCGYSTSAVDQLRIVEARNRHVQSIGHLQKAFTEAFKPLSEAFLKAFKAVDDATKQYYQFSAPPRNVPHDPALRNDKRKWGGK